MTSSPAPVAPKERVTVLNRAYTDTRAVMLWVAQGDSG